MLNAPDQDSPAWHKWRAKGLGSSDAAVLMACSPWTTIQELWEEKLGLKEPKPMNYAMKIGKDMEATARDIYCWDTRTDMTPKLFEHPRYPFMRASMDGFNDELWKGIEIKVPGKKTVEMARRNEVPDHYYAQIQWQMLVSCSHELDYVVLDKDCSDLFIISIGEDREYQKRLVILAKYFWKHVQTKKELPMLSVLPKLARLK